MYVFSTLNTFQMKREEINLEEKEVDLNYPGWKCGEGQGSWQCAWYNDHCAEGYGPIVVIN